MVNRSVVRRGSGSIAKRTSREGFLGERFGTMLGELRIREEYCQPRRN